jgi:hypothetical protein
MKQLVLLLLLTCAWGLSPAQVNLVLNPSFEQYTQCPEGFQQIRFAKNWDGIDTSYHIGDSAFYFPFCIPDFCNECSTIGGYATVPVNGSFYQYPRTGNGIVCIRLFDDTLLTGDPHDLREYLQGRLSQPLMADTPYCVSFYVNMAEGTTDAIDNIGAYIDDGSIDGMVDSIDCSYPLTRIAPQIYSPAIINDTVNWVKIQGRFTATGTEKFITIGNFAKYANIHKTFYRIGGGYSFYLIDDVSVVAGNSVANAGPDAFVSPGSDSAWIGTHEEGLPCTWYIAGSYTPISYYGGFMVHPDTTTRYVMELDLCDNVTFDTVTVFAAPAGTPIVNAERFQIYPNPSNGIFTIEQAKGTEVVIYDVIGKEVHRLSVVSNKQQIDISGLAKGVYVLNIITPLTKEQVTKRIINL